MASVNWAKHKSRSKLVGLLKHNCTEVRKEINHKNNDIDTTKTDKNWQNRTYEEALKFYDDRQKELLTFYKPNTRKDRVNIISLVTTRPKDLQEKDFEKWNEEVGKIIEKRFGKENIVHSSFQYDEVHEYINPDTNEKVLSREHRQDYIIPVHNNRISAKHIWTVPKMQSLNKEIHQMTKANFGVDFMDGTKKKSRGSVEEMKIKSENAKIEKEQYEIKLTRKAFTKAIKDTKEILGVSSLRDKPNLKQDLEAIQKQILFMQTHTKELKLKEERLKKLENELNNLNATLEAQKRLLNDEKRNFDTKVQQEVNKRYNSLVDGLIEDFKTKAYKSYNNNLKGIKKRYTQSEHDEIVRLTQEELKSLYLNDNIDYQNNNQNGLDLD